MADRHDVQLRTKLLEKIFPPVDIVDNLESDNPNRPLSARQGKVLKELINAGGGGGSGLSIEVVESLPATGVKGILYLVPKTSYLKEENTYDEYVWIESSQKYELLGSFSTDLNIEEYVDKINSILGEVGEINVATLSDYGINSYVTTGTYRVYGERLNTQDGLPILNAANGHTVEGILKILDSSISDTGETTDKVVTQILTMSNRTGGDGHIWIRTGQGADKSSLTWSTWEKLQGIFEKNNVTTLEDLDGYTTNGMYSGIYAGTEPKNFYTVQFLPLDTFLMITVNGYAVSKLAVPQITQLLYKLPAKTSTSKQNAEIYLRTGSYNKTDKIWVWDTFTKMVTNADLDSQVAVLNANINAISDKADTAKATAIAAQTKNIEQDERLMHIEENLAHLGIAGRYWDEDNVTSTAQGYYGSLQALRNLPNRLGLGRYLVTDDRKRKKLNPTDSTKYSDGTPAALDGSEGQCMWCWNGFYANIWHEGSRLIKAVTFDKPVGGETSVWIPAGGISWLGAGVMDRTNQKLCSLISDAEQYRGGGGAALNPASYPKAPSVESPQISMLGMPATAISTTDFGHYARKRGEGWEANWFVARFVVEFLFEVIMGTENSQAAFNADKDENGLYQGGFGDGVSTMSDWGNYNGYYPLIPTSVGLEAGDGVCVVPYSLPQTNGVEGEEYKAFNVPVFFGLVGAGFGHLWSWTRGIIMDAGEEKSLVYVTPSMYADYNPNTVADKIMVAECPQVEGYIKRKRYQGLCCMPTEVGGSATIRFADYFYTNAKTSKGLRVRAAGGYASHGTHAGASCTHASNAATSALTSYSAPLCYFEKDPIIP